MSDTTIERIARFAGHEFAPDLLAKVPRTWLGGLPIALLDRAATADLMIAAAQSPVWRDRPLIMTSANGEVISRCRSEPEI